MDINWMNVFDWQMLLRCFVTGGIICVIGQILKHHSHYNLI